MCKKTSDQPLGTAGVGRDDDGVLPVGYVVHDPLDDGRLGEQVVDGYVEEALNLRGVQVHGDYVVGACHAQHVGD